MDSTERAALTERQQEVYDYILDFTKKNLFPPSYMEIAQNTKVCGKAEVSRILRILERKGYLKVIDNTPRGITLTGYTLVKVE